MEAFSRKLVWKLCGAILSEISGIKYEHTFIYNIGGSRGGVPGACPPYGTQFFRFCIHFH